MPTRANETKRNIYAAEGIAGGAALAAVGSNRVPEFANSVVRNRRKREYAAVKSKVKRGRGQTSSGKWIKLKRLSDDPAPKPAAVPVVVNGQPKLKPDGSPVMNVPKYDSRSERMLAGNRANETKIKAKNAYKSRSKLPFPTENWKFEDDPKHKPKSGKNPRQIKVKHVRDPETGLKVKTAAHIGEGRRKALLAVGIPAATAVMWHGGYQAARQQRIMNERNRRASDVSKSTGERDVSAAVTGGTLGVAAYQAPSMTEWIFRGKEDKKLKNNPKTQKIVDKWKKKHGIEAGTQKGQPIWDEAYRDYPKSLPGSKLRRTMAYTHTGGTGRAAFLASAVGGAGLGVAADRKILRKKPDAKNH